MARLVWNQNSEKKYNYGVEKAALFVGTQSAAWNGIVSIQKTVDGGEPTAFYGSDVKYAELSGDEQIGLNITAYGYPDIFIPCLGFLKNGGMVTGQQARTKFGLVWSTRGGDGNGAGRGKIKIAYNCLAAPSETEDATTDDGDPEIVEFDWDISTTPVENSIGRPTAYIEINLDELTQAQQTALENAFFGTEDTDPILLTPDQIKTITTTTPVPFTATATASDDGAVITYSGGTLDADTFTAKIFILADETLTFLESDEYTVSINDNVVTITLTVEPEGDVLYFTNARNTLGVSNSKNIAHSTT